jgi:hypothetical protein
MSIQHIILAAAIGVAPTQALDPELPRAGKLDPGQRFVCAEPGGCYVSNKAMLEKLMLDGYELGEAAGQAQCGRPS